MPKPRHPPAPATPIKELRQPFADCLAAIITRTGLERRAFAQHIGYSPSHLGGVVSSNQNPAAGIVDAVRACELVSEAEVLTLATLYEAFRDARAGLIDTYKGARHKQSHGVDVLEGDWYACWQTVRDDVEALLIEGVSISAKSGGRFLMANVAGAPLLDTRDRGQAAPPSYLNWEWKAECELTLASRVSGQLKSDNRLIDGLFHLKLDPLHTIMVGYWMGVSYDSDQTVALLAIGRELDATERQFARAQGQHPQLPFYRGSSGIKPSPHAPANANGGNISS
jgi:hypothetical protein